MMHNFFPNSISMENQIDASVHHSDSDISKISDSNFVELSDLELDEISGGIDVSISYVFGQTSTDISSQTTVMDDGASSSSLNYSSQTSIFGFQFEGSFQSMGHFWAFKSRLDSFFQSLGFW
ncbi:MAG: hypothetical protein AAGD25_02550 [Cyanobacteria bacterium P01_F01_bin.150]